MVLLFLLLLVLLFFFWKFIKYLCNINLIDLILLPYAIKGFLIVVKIFFWLVTLLFRSDGWAFLLGIILIIGLIEKFFK